MKLDTLRGGIRPNARERQPCTYCRPRQMARCVICNGTGWVLRPSPLRLLAFDFFRKIGVSP